MQSKNISTWVQVSDFQVKFSLDYIKLPSSLADGALFLLMHMMHVFLMPLPSTIRCLSHFGPWPTAVSAGTGGGAGGVARRPKGGGGGAGLNYKSH